MVAFISWIYSSRPFAFTVSRKLCREKDVSKSMLSFCGNTRQKTLRPKRVSKYVNLHVNYCRRVDENIILFKSTQNSYFRQCSTMQNNLFWNIIKINSHFCHFVKNHIPPKSGPIVCISNTKFWAKNQGSRCSLARGWDWSTFARMEWPYLTDLL